MEFLYICIILIALLMEFSSKINTDNILRKMSLGVIIVGALIHIANRANPLIEIGILGYFMADVVLCYFSKRRRSDHETNWTF